ncbi:MAG: PTS sugar transporter subunit IIA [Paracoccaceae bacterium]
MIGIVIVAHGGLAQEYLAALEHVVGRHRGTRAVAIAADDDRDTKQSEIDQAIKAVDDGSGVVIVTDIHGGTPANLACRASADESRVVLCGANLPLLIKLSQARRLKLRDAVDCALTAGRKYMNSAERLDANGIMMRF